jgi:hypothetical protein
MMLQFDSSTLANLTAALDHGCKSLPPDFDTTENRKRLGDALLSAARSHRRSLVQLSEVAEEVVAEIVRGSGNSVAGAILQSLKGLF